MSERVAVFVTTYNRPRGLRAALDSVLAQTHRDIRVVVLDDGSDPRPQLADICDDERVALVHFEKRDARYKTRVCTLSARLNAAVGFANGCDFMSYCTDTGFYQPDRIERLIAGWHEAQRCNPDKRVGFVWGEQTTSFRPEPNIGHMEEWPAAALLRRLNAGNFIDYASVLERVGLCGHIAWDERGSAWPHNDWLRWIQHANAGNMAVRIPTHSDYKDCSGPEHMGQVFRRNGDVADFTDRARE